MKTLLVVVSVILFSSCAVDEEINFTSSLCEAIATNDDRSLRTIIDDICDEYKPNVTVNDPGGHQINLQKVIEDINNTFDCAEASLVCYACIETYPPISEIRIETTVDSVYYFVVLDILTPENSEMSFQDMH